MTERPSYILFITDQQRSDHLACTGHPTLQTPNIKHSGEVKGQASEKMFYVCLLEADKPKQWEGMICDPSVPNTCPFFEPHKSEQDVEDEVERILTSGDMVEIASNFPDLAALLWVLSEDTNTGEEDA